MRILVSIIFLSLITFNVQANSMRCGNKLIVPGDSKGSVLLRCGRPLLQETTKLIEKTQARQAIRLTPSKADGDKVVRVQDKIKDIVAVDQWTYDLGSGQFLRILIFKGPTLVDIELGERVD